MVTDTFAIHKLPRQATNFTRNYITLKADTVGEFDSEGIQLYVYGNGRHYHPISMSLRAIRLLNGFVDSHDSAYLLLARVYCDKMISMAIDHRGAKWLPYTFDFELHNDPRNHVSSPWFSGMAQGEALQAFLYAVEVTGDSAYAKFSDALFQSFRQIWGVDSTYGTWIDSAGYYWIEGYPRPVPDMTFSSYFAGLFGIYQYWLLTGSKDAEQLTRASLATIARYGMLYRRPGSTSKYCLAHGEPTDIGYHNFHIALLRKLAEMSDNPAFTQCADSLAADTGQ